MMLSSCVTLALDRDNYQLLLLFPVCRHSLTNASLRFSVAMSFLQFIPLCNPSLHCQKQKKGKTNNKKISSLAMGEVPEKVESEYPSEPPPPQQTPVAVIELPEPAGDITDEKALVPHPPSVTEEKSGALAMVEKAPEFAEEKTTESSNHRDAVLARLETEKRISLIKAWEESEKSKAKNKAQRKLSAVGAWENSKEASAEAELKKIKEKLEKKKAEYVEKMRNRVALIHRAAEEKRAIIEAKRGEDLLKAEEMAAKYRVKGSPPKKLLGIF